MSAEHKTTPKLAPAWCGYPDPWTPFFGCWSLLGGKISKREDCGDCDCAALEAADGAR